MSTKSICRSCEMLVGTDEYHPHAACLMYRTCGDETAVRLNLAEVMAHGAQEVAPDLLEALELCLEELDSCDHEFEGTHYCGRCDSAIDRNHEIREKAARAIAKTKGEA